MNTNKKNWSRYTLGFFICFFIRLLPFRPPNIEPLLSTQMPFSKVYGIIPSFLFSFLSIILYDVTTGTLGIWTSITALSYGLLGVWSAFFFRKRKNSAYNYAWFAVMATIAYDIVTGLSIGPLFFHQSFMQALIGQIPFTALHLLGNVSFALVISPALYLFITHKKIPATSQTFILTNTQNI